MIAHQRNTDKTLSSANLRDIYRTASLIRTAENKILKLLRSGAISFPFYPVTGQEIAPAVLAHCLGKDDQMVTIYRGLADQLAKGLSLFEVLGECIGHSAGLCGGTGGGMGIAKPELGIMMTTGIVGSGAPVANGLGLASQLQGTGKVVAVSFGDGATSIGAVHEAMHMASLWKLPVIFVCHNNQWAESTPFAEYSTIDRLSRRAEAYSMAGVTVDGADPVALQAVFAEAVERASSGAGPTFIESMTYRLCGHYYADQGPYMDKERLAQERDKDPVPALRARLIAEGHASIDQLDSIDAQVAAIVDADCARLLDTPDDAPTRKALRRHVYEDPDFVPVSRHAAPADPVPAAVRKGTMRDGFNEALSIALERDPGVIALGEDIADPAGGVTGVTRGLSTQYGLHRVRSTPIAEQAIFGAVVGAGLAGMRPVGELLMMDFLPVAMDQLISHAAKVRFMTGGQVHCPMTMITLIGQGNGAQHSQSTEAWLMHTPGLKVAYPSTPADAKGLLLTAIFDNDPCIVLECMSLLYSSGDIPEGDYRIPFGSAAVRREGSDVSIISYGATMTDALAAADLLAADGISAEVIDLRSLVPLDGHTILKSVAKTGRAVIAHRATEFLGASAEISSLINSELFGQLKAPVQRVAGDYTPVPKSTKLLGVYFQGAAAIVSAAKETL
ncbi:alpha-ketoacid dehydrogenase subunit alpha/beta [Noviherbaspirillum sedimenti]|uniref:Dehydrogenase n=1 Tax=Noviherbaspirillum sedimenti TaxID=2320865 RepID=A0A3A3FWW0_9BURK|nr:alpha-ketoacid dehydrogenase subunit alpha/beta [Noviherbaspirillum sedimenti]RJG00627.1 dehydrogenase [Noviherbaspirillum sedimenti]